MTGLGQTEAMIYASGDDPWNQQDEELLPWPIADPNELGGRSGLWGTVLALVVAAAAALVMMWGTIDYFVG